MTSKDYVSADGMTCPACNAEDAVESAGQPLIDGARIWLQVRCPNCGATWTETYALTGFDSLEKGTSAD